MNPFIIIQNYIIAHLPGKTLKLPQNPEFFSHFTIRRQSDYKDNKVVYNKIEGYINYYLDKLSAQKRNGFKVFYTGDLGNSELYERREMLLKLIRESFMDKSAFDDGDIVKKTIALEKNKLYLKDVENMSTDTLIRMVALNEILEQKMVTHSKRGIVNSEITNLSNSLFLLVTNIMTIMGEVETYKQSINTDIRRDKLNSIKEALKEPQVDISIIGDQITNNQNTNAQKKDNQKIEDMFQSLAKIAKEIIDVSDIEESDKDYYIKMAMLEKRLEEYFYSHPKYINNCIEEFKEIVSNAKNIYSMLFRMNEHEIIRFDEQTYLTNKIMALDKRIKLYEKFSYRAKEDELIIKTLRDYYRKKMEIIIVNNIDGLDIRLFEDDGEIARKTYKEEIEKRTDRIGRGVVTNPPFSDKNYKLGIKAIKNVFLSTIGSFDSDMILTNGFLLSFLFSLDNYILFNKMLDGVVNRLDFLGIEFDKKYINCDQFVTFNPELPLRTICEVLKGDDSLKKDSSSIAKAMSSLVELYKMCIPEVYDYEEDSKYYRLPEGILQILERSRWDNIKEESYSARLKEETKGKYVIMPSSMKAIYGNDVLNSDLIGIEFSNGTEEINIDYNDFEEVVIPPTVSSFMIYTFLTESTYSIYKYKHKSRKDLDEKPECITRKIIFNDYKNSVFLHPTNKSDVDKVNHFFHSLINYIEVVFRAPNEKDRIIEINENSPDYIDIGCGVHINGREVKTRNIENKLGSFDGK